MSTCDLDVWFTWRVTAAGVRCAFVEAEAGVSQVSQTGGSAALGPLPLVADCSLPVIAGLVGFNPLFVQAARCFVVAAVGELNRLGRVGGHTHGGGPRE